MQKRMWVVLGVVGIGATAAGCGGGSGGPGGPGSSSGASGSSSITEPTTTLQSTTKIDVKAEAHGTVTVALASDDPGDLALRKKQAAAFEKLYPKIKIKIQLIPAQSYDQKIATEIAGGNAPDVFGTGDVVIPSLVKKNYTLDLLPYMKADGYDTSALLPQVLEGLTYDGKVVGLTDNWDTQVMYYNKDMFAKAGVAEPTNDWTWDDYMAAAKKLTSGSGRNKIYGSEWQKWWVPIADAVGGAGGSEYDQAGTKCTLTDPKSVAGLSFVQSLVKAGVDPGPTENGALGMEGDEFFLNGKAAMMIGAGRWAAYEFLGAKFNWAIAPIPKGPAGRSNFFHLGAYAIPSNSKNPDAAWKFLRFITSEQGVLMGAENAQGMPAIKALVDNPVIKNTAVVTKHNGLQPFLDSLPSARRAPQLSNFALYQDKIDAAVLGVWQGKTTPEKAAASACKAVDAQFAKGS